MNNFVSDEQRKAVMANLNQTNKVNGNDIKIDISIPQQTSGNKMLASNKSDLMHGEKSQLDKKLISEREMAQKKQLRYEDVDADQYNHYEGYEAGIVTVQGILRDAKGGMEKVLEKLRKEKERGMKEVDKGKLREDEEHENYYEGYTNGIRTGIIELQKYDKMKHSNKSESLTFKKSQIKAIDNAINQYEAIGNKGKYQCHFCTQTFDDDKEYTDHEKSVHPEALKMHQDMLTEVAKKTIQSELGATGER